MKWLTIKLGGQNWGVHVVKEGSRLLEGCQGITYPDEAKIYLSRGLAPDVFVDTLVHEILHALFWVSGVAHVLRANCKPRKSEATEETIVRMITPLLHRALSDLGFRFPKGPYE
jgi:hypothetical protein